MKKVDALEKNTGFPMQGLLEDGGGHSEKQIPVSSSSLELCPSYSAPSRPQIPAESTTPMSIFNWHVVTGLTLIMGKDQHAMLSQNALFRDKYPKPDLSLWKFLYTGVVV